MLRELLGEGTGLKFGQSVRASCRKHRLRPDEKVVKRLSREERSLSWMDRRDKRGSSSCKGPGQGNTAPMRKLKVDQCGRSSESTEGM